MWSAAERLDPWGGGAIEGAADRERAASFVSEHRLSFGITISSNVGQRAAELYLAIFRRRFDLEERDYFEAVLDSSTGHCAGAGLKDGLMRRSDR